MKKALQTTIASAVLAGSMGATTAVAEGANGVGVSMTMGYLTDYIFRGAALSSGTANGSIDLEFGGAYAGVWTADLDGGIEVDIYGGYIQEFNGAYLGAGYTSYQYTESDTSVQNEVNLYAGYEANGASIDLEFSIGEDSFKGTDTDYDVFIATVGYNGLFASYGTWGDEFDGDFWAVGYGMELAGFDLSFSVGGSEEASSTDDDIVTDGDTRAVVEVSWGWDIL